MDEDDSIQNFFYNVDVKIRREIYTYTHTDIYVHGHQNKYRLGSYPGSQN